MQNHKQQPESGTPSVQPQAQGEPKFTSGEGTKAQSHEGTEGAEIELTPAELAVDIPRMLLNNDAAIECLKRAGIAVPPEAFEMQTVLRRCVHAEAEVVRLTQWVHDLQSGMYINCVYCGHRYGPEDKVPATMADALKAHIATCDKHPMSQLLKLSKELLAFAKSCRPFGAVLDSDPDFGAARTVIAKAGGAA